MSSNYTYTSLPLFGLLVPDSTVEAGPDGVNVSLPLPGLIQFYTEVEGVPVLLFERKAGKLLQRIEAAKSAGDAAAAAAPPPAPAPAEPAPAEPPAPDAPPAPADDSAA